MSRRGIVSAVAGVLVTAASLLGSAPAHAGLPLIAHADVEITYNQYGFRVCAGGRVDDGTASSGQWLLVIEGARSDGSRIRDVLRGSGPSWDPGCQGVPRYGASSGGFVVTLSFTGVGSNSPNPVPDFTAVAGGEATWNLYTVTSFGT
jgi:hypothetical protein